MVSTCVGVNSCGSHGPGWLSTQHPFVSDVIVTAIPFFTGVVAAAFGLWKYVSVTVAGFMCTNLDQHLPVIPVIVEMEKVGFTEGCALFSNADLE